MLKYYNNIDENLQFPNFCIPKKFYKLRSIVCHMGSINYGHYYCLVLQQNGTIKNYNDRQVSDFSDSYAALKQISGTDVTPREESESTTATTITKR